MVWKPRWYVIWKCHLDSGCKTARPASVVIVVEGAETTVNIVTTRRV